MWEMAMVSTVLGGCATLISLKTRRGTRKPYTTAVTREARLIFSTRTCAESTTEFASLFLLCQQERSRNGKTSQLRSRASILAWHLPRGSNVFNAFFICFHQ